MMMKSLSSKLLKHLKRDHVAKECVEDEDQVDADAVDSEDSEDVII